MNLPTVKLIEHKKDDRFTTYYEILGVKKSATQKEIRAAYKRLSKLHHPDAGGDIKMFQAVQEAYETLSDPERRFLYDTFNYSQEELQGALNIIISIMVPLFAKNIKTEKQVRNQVKLQLDNHKAEIEKAIKDINGGTFLINSIIGEIDNVGSFVNKKMVESLRGRVATNENAVEKHKQQLRVFEVAAVLVNKVNLKTKDLDPTNWWSTATVSSTTSVFRVNTNI